MAASGKTPFLSVEEIKALGFKLILYPNFMMLAAIPAMHKVLQELKSKGSVKDLVGEVASFQDFFNLLGMDEVKLIEEKYLTNEECRVRY